MKSKWLPTFPLHVTTWLADPRIRDLTAAQRSDLLDALLLNWMARGESQKRIKKSIKEAYDFWAPQYDAERQRCEKSYARRAKRWGEYSRLLADPRWAARRAQILERDDHTCRDCGATAKLHVHHLRYVKGGMPWDSPDDDLLTVCGPCHDRRHRRAA